MILVGEVGRGFLAGSGGGNGQGERLHSVGQPGEAEGREQLFSGGKLQFFYLFIFTRNSAIALVTVVKQKAFPFSPINNDF